MIPDLPRLHGAMEGTWPPAARHELAGWTLRDGAGGGKRVSAATQARPGASVEAAEQAMRAAGQTPLFMIRAGEEALDAALHARGYEIADPTCIYCCPVGQLADVPVPKVSTFAVWEPLAIMEEIWAGGGIDAARLAVMARARVKTGILGRWSDKPAGVAFAAVHDGICMVHAAEVLPQSRRKGMAGWLMRKAAFWGAEQGATHLAVLCTEANTAANALYVGLGMQRAGQYHYRKTPEEPR